MLGTTYELNTELKVEDLLPKRANLPALQKKGTNERV